MRMGSAAVTVATLPTTILAPDLKRHVWASIGLVLGSKRQTQGPLGRAVQREAGADWWLAGGGTCIAAYQPKGSANLAASYVDLSGSGNNCGPGVAPAWGAATGWQFNGTTQHLDTGVVCALPQSYAVQFSNMGSPAGAHSLFGEGFISAYPNWWGKIALAYGVGVFMDNPPAMVAGNIIMTPQGGYRNGALDIAWIAMAPIGWACYIAANHGPPGIAGALAQVHIQAFAMYNSDITAHVAALAAAMAAL